MLVATPRPLHHIGICVPDIAAAIDWYAEVMGFRLFTGPAILDSKNDPRGQLRNLFGSKFRQMKIAHLSTAGGCGFELFEPIDPPFQKAPDDVEYWRGGLFHFCVTDPDIEGLVSRIKSTGGRQLSEIFDDRPPQNMRMVYCQDPFGTLIEVHTHSYEIVQGWRS